MLQSAKGVMRKELFSKWLKRTESQDRAVWWLCCKNRPNPLAEK